MCVVLAPAAVAALQIASAAAAIGGTVVSAVGAKKQADFQAEQAHNAARQEEIRADQELYKSAQEQRAFDKQNAYQRGTMMAQLAASGADTTSGTALELLTDTAREQAIDRQNLAYNGQIAATNHLNSAASLNAQASGYKAAGTNALIGGGLSAAGSILGQAGGLFESGAPEITGLDSATKKGKFNKKY